MPPGRVVIAGGGPAGMMLGLLLARAGIETQVLEKHADFLRDFRGDTIHPSTLELLHELGWLDELLQEPHQKAPRLEADVFGTRVGVDFRRVPTRCKFLVFMPQWHFLSFLARKAAAFPSFRLSMETEAVGLLRDGARVTGVRSRGPQGEAGLPADLVVAADGRASAVRDASGLELRPFGAPIDVLWFRLPREPLDRELPLGRFEPGAIFLMLNQGTHWQCGFVIAKGGLERVKAAGLPAFKTKIAALSPMVAGRLDALRSWDDVKLLTVRVDRLRRWHLDGLLCIGDAAHAMSPVGGVGINLAIQDAVAAANLLAGPLRSGRPSEAELARVQARREWPTRLIQGLQVFAQERVISRVLAAEAPDTPLRAPWFVRLAARLPLLQHLPGRLVGLGVRPEHVR